MAGDASAGRAPTDDDRKPTELLLAQLEEDGRPSLIELIGRGLAATTRHQVGLLDEHDGDLQRERRLPRRDEVGCTDTTARTVPQDEGGDRPMGWMQVRSRGSLRRVELYDAGSVAVTPRLSTA
jgi:hypothetical protein